MTTDAQTCGSFEGDRELPISIKLFKMIVVCCIILLFLLLPEHRMMKLMNHISQHYNQMAVSKE
jgi:hypothetical protein